MLYVVPSMFILAGWARGSFDGERRLIVAMACLMVVAFVPAMAVAVKTDVRLIEGSAYALAVMATSMFAMLLRRRPDPDDGGGNEPQPGDPPPSVDWDDFERRFWDDVRRRQPPRVPA